MSHVNHLSCYKKMKAKVFIWSRGRLGSMYGDISRCGPRLAFEMDESPQLTYNYAYYIKEASDEQR